MKTGAMVAIGVGLAVLGVAGVAMASGGKPSGPPPPPKDADLQRGYQVTPGCRIIVLDDTLPYKWAASLGSDPTLSVPQAIAKAIGPCTPESVMAAITSPADIKPLYYMLHALKAAAVTAGKYTKEQFNAEIGQSLAMIGMYFSKDLDTSGWPGPLP